MIRDSMVSCFVKYLDLEFHEFEGSFDKVNPLMDKAILDQIQTYLQRSHEHGVRFEVFHHSEAEKFHADKHYY